MAEQPHGYTTIEAFMEMIRRDDVRRANPVGPLLERSGLSKGHYFEIRKTDGTSLRVDTLQRLALAYGAEVVILIK